jgi:MFS family permease
VSGPRETVRRTFRSLHVRNFRLWFFGQTISLTGTWMQSVAQAWLVVQLTGSAVDLGLTAAFQFGPVLVLGAYGGVIADRFDKRRVLLITQMALLVQALALGGLVLSGRAEVWMVWGLALIMGIVNAVDNPTRQSFAVEMVGHEDVANAVALNSVIVNASRIVGPAVAAVLIATAGLTWTFFFNAATFLAVVGALLAMRRDELHIVPRVAAARGQIRAGLRYAWDTWELRIPLLLIAVVATLAYNFGVLLPLLATDVFHRGGGTYGALAAAMGAGALIGALVTASRPRLGFRTLILVTGAFGVLELAVALAPSFDVTMLLLVPMGAAGIAFIAVSNALLQQHTKNEMRGRVMALWAIVFLGSTFFGGPLTGLLSGYFGARAALAFAGAVTGLATLAVAVALRRIRAGHAAETAACTESAAP